MSEQQEEGGQNSLLIVLDECKMLLMKTVSTASALFVVVVQPHTRV